MERIVHSKTEAIWLKGVILEWAGIGRLKKTKKIYKPMKERRIRRLSMRKGGWKLLHQEDEDLDAML